jgi:hypothetical protein
VVYTRNFFGVVVVYTRNFSGWWWFTPGIFRDGGGLDQDFVRGGGVYTRNFFGG